MFLHKGEEFAIGDNPIPNRTLFIVFTLLSAFSILTISVFANAVRFLILGLGSAILTGVLLTCAAIIGNHVIQAEFGILTSLLTVGPRQILLIFGLSLLVTTLASLIPTARLAAQKPIDVIRG